MTPRHILTLTVAALAIASATVGQAQEEGSSKRRLSKRELRAAAKKFDEALGSRDDAQVTRGVEEFAAKDDPRVVEQVIEKALLGANLAAVRAASQSLRQVRNPASHQAITDAFDDSRKTWQRMRLIRLLDALPAATTQRSLSRALRDKFFGIREAALHAIASVPVAELEDAASRALRDDHLRVRLAAARAVSALGGKVPEGLTVNSAGPLSRPLGSDGIAFVVAASDAMAKTAVIPPDLLSKNEIPNPEGDKARAPATATHLEIVGRLISQAVANESKSLRWDALTFNLSVSSFAGKKSPARGGPKGVADLERWMRNKRTDRARDIHRALQAAIDLEWVDTIVLFTDGLPAQARIKNPQEIVDTVSLDATDRALLIHTVTVSGTSSSEGLSKAEVLRLRQADDELRGFVSALANETGGNSRSLVLAGPEGGATAANPKPADPGSGGARRPDRGGQPQGGTARGSGKPGEANQPPKAEFSIKLRGTDRVVESELTRVKRALQNALSDGPDAKTELEAILAAMGSCPDPKVTEIALEEGLFHADPEISHLTLTALSTNQHEKVHRLLADRASKERDAAQSYLLAACLAAARGPAAVDELVDLLDHDAPRTRSCVARLLASLPQTDLAPAGASLQRAFDREDSTRVRHELARALERANGTAPEGYEMPTVASGDWLPDIVPSGRVVFLVDVNQSMGTSMVDPRAALPSDQKDEKEKPNPAKPISRLDLAARAVSEAVSRMPQDARFAVTAFGGLPRRFSRSGLTKAKGNAASKVLTWLKDQRLAPDRDPMRAMKAVFKDDQVDTIYLITDGLPQRASTSDTDEILKELWRLNRTRQIPIHVIVPVGSNDHNDLSDIDRAQRLDQRAELLAFLKQIASQNRGSFTVADGSPSGSPGTAR